MSSCSPDLSHPSLFSSPPLPGPFTGLREQRWRSLNVFVAKSGTETMVEGPISLREEWLECAGQCDWLPSSPKLCTQGDLTEATGLSHRVCNQAYNLRKKKKETKNLTPCVSKRCRISMETKLLGAPLSRKGLQLSQKDTLIITGLSECAKSGIKRLPRKAVCTPTPST